MSIYKGSGVALATPFDKFGAFRADIYEDLIMFHALNGTAAIISCGTTGEASTLTSEEHVQVVEAAVEACKKAKLRFGHQMPVVAGAGGNNTAACVQIAQSLMRVGADALMFTTPYYNKTSQDGLVAHFEKIASACDVPIMIYNIPGRTGMNMQPATLARLAQIENITAIKEASGDVAQVAQMAALCEGKIDIYTGNDDIALAVLALGGVGMVSTVANVAPRGVADLAAAVFEGDLVRARELQFWMLPLLDQLFADVNPMPVKAALRMLGFEVGDCRLPLVKIRDEHREQLAATMATCGLL